MGWYLVGQLTWSRNRRLRSLWDLHPPLPFPLPTPIQPWIHHLPVLHNGKAEPAGSCVAVQRVQTILRRLNRMQVISNMKTKFNTGDPPPADSLPARMNGNWQKCDFQQETLSANLMCDCKILEFAKLGLATAEYLEPRRGVLFPTAAPAFKFTQVHKVPPVTANMRVKY